MPSIVTEEYVKWTQVRADEDYNVTIYRGRPGFIEVEHVFWDDDEQDWNGTIVPAEDVTENIILFLP